MSNPIIDQIPPEKRTRAYYEAEINLLNSTAELRHSNLPASRRDFCQPIETLTAGELERLQFLALELEHISAPYRLLNPNL